jgi:hypothetical protein
MSLLHKFLLAVGIAASSTANAVEPKIVRDAITSAEWIAEALSSSGYKADFSLESLKEIDRFIDEQAPNGKPKPDGLLAEDLGARVFAIGSYVGAVVLRNNGGEWIGNDNDPEAEINIEVQLKNGTVLWPVQRVMKRLRNGNEDGIYIYGVTITSPTNPASGAH